MGLRPKINHGACRRPDGQEDDGGVFGLGEALPGDTPDPRGVGEAARLLASGSSFRQEGGGRKAAPCLTPPPPFEVSSPVGKPAWGVEAQPRASHPRKRAEAKHVPCGRQEAGCRAALALPSGAGLPPAAELPEAASSPPPPSGRCDLRVTE